MSQLGDITQGAPQSSSGGKVESLGSHGGVPGIDPRNGLCELACTPVLLSGHIPSLLFLEGRGERIYSHKAFYRGLNVTCWGHICHKLSLSNGIKGSVTGTIPEKQENAG